MASPWQRSHLWSRTIGPLKARAPPFSPDFAVNELSTRAAGRVTICTMTPHEDRVGHERSGLRRRHQRSANARQGAEADPAVATGSYRATGSDLGRAF